MRPPPSFALTVALVAGGCAERATPPAFGLEAGAPSNLRGPTAAPQEIPMLDCTILSQTDTELRVRYAFENRTDGPIFVFDQLLAPAGSTRQPHPKAAYVLGGPGGALLTKQLVPVPDDVDVEAPEVPLARRLEPGERLEGHMMVPLPLETRRPYARDAVPLRAPIRCGLGFVPAEASEARPDPEHPGLWRVRYSEPLVEAQRVETAALEG